MKQLYRLLLLLWCCVSALHAETKVDAIHLLTKDDGMAGETVSRVIIDKYGRAVVATNDGISIYNGKRFTTFKMRRDVNMPNYVYDVCIDNLQNIYVATAQGVFEKKVNKASFQLILKEFDRMETLAAHEGKLYLGNTNGFYVYDGKKVKQVAVKSFAKEILANSVRSIKVGEDGNLWFLTRYALNRYVPSSGKVSPFYLAADMPKRAAMSQFGLLGDKAYIGTKNNGLFVYYFNSKKIRKIPYVSNVITSIQVTSKGDVCVGTDGSGAFLLDGKTGQLKEKFDMNGDKEHRTPCDAVYYYMKDGHGNDWLGFYRFGLAHSYYNQHIFEPYRFGDFTTEKLNVRSFYINKYVKVIGTNKGLYYINETKNIVKHFPAEMLGGAHIITKIYYHLGLFYIATYDGGLKIFDPASLTIRPILNAPEVLSNTTIISLASRNNGELWIGTAEGLFVLDKAGRIVKKNGGFGGTVTGLYFDKGGNGWVCSEKMAYYSAQKESYDNTVFPKGFFNIQKNVEAIPGKNGRIYFFKQNKIFFTTQDMKLFGQLQLPAELSDKCCYAFLDDRNRSFWLATDNGLFCLDYQMQNFVHFGAGEGLKCQFVNVDGIQVDQDGVVWVATTNGLMRLNSKALDQWLHRKKFNLSLFDIRIGSDLLDFTDENKVNSTKRILLPWNILSAKLALKVILLNYSHNKDRLYQYCLGDGDKWVTFADGDEVSLSHLFLGMHRLKLRLAGVASSESNIEILVYPSWLAIMEFVILIVALILLLFWRRYHKDTKVLLEERNEIEGALMEVEQEQQETEQAGLQIPKYTRVKIDEEEFAEIVSRMKAYIEKNRCYTDPNFKMGDLADALGLSSSKLSQVFSLYVKENYYEFINKYRLVEFKRLIETGEYKRFTLTALSEKCGFKKSSFFSTFRRVEGMTPMEYLKKRNVKL